MKVLAYRLGLLVAVGGVALGLAALAPSNSSAQAPTPSCSLTVTPSSIQIGQSVTLRWNSANATEGSITDVGGVSPTGSINLLPSSASVTRYEATFVGPGGTVRCSTSVTVSAQGTGLDPGFINQTQTNQGGGGLVSCGNSSNPILATMCNLCDIGTLIQNIINFLILLSIPLLAGLFAWAGILYFTAQGGSESIDKAHRIFKSVFIGFVMVVMAYFVVQTLLSAILDQQNFFTSGSWSNLQCADPSHNPSNADYNPQNPDARPRTSSISQLFSAITTMGGSITTGGTVSPTQTPTTPTGDVYSDQRARAALAAACSGNECFTYTSTGSCSDPNNSSCTSLDGVRQATVARLTTLQSECGCTINISGGTEVGHGTPGAGNVHTNGTAFDLSKNSNLDRVITNYPAVTPVSIGGGATAPAYRAPDGTLFINEGSHWHLQMQNRPL